MPTYEYECKQCGHRFEAFQSMKDAPLTACPKCQGPVRRLIGTGAGILFKGSGFYGTDYRSRSYKEKARQEGGKAKDPGGAGAPEGGGAKPEKPEKPEKKSDAGSGRDA